MKFQNVWIYKFNFHIKLNISNVCFKVTNYVRFKVTNYLLQLLYFLHSFIPKQGLFKGH